MQVIPCLRGQPVEDQIRYSVLPVVSGPLLLSDTNFIMTLAVVGYSLPNQPQLQVHPH